MLVFEKRALETRPRNVALVAGFIRPGRCDRIADSQKNDQGLLV
jgi:hypothetical protein